MSVLSKALRFAVLVSVFGGCATSSAPQWTSPDRAANPGDGSDTVATTESDTQINDSVSGLAAELPTDTAAPTGSQELLGVNDAGVGVELERGTGYTKVLVSSPTENPYEVTSMDSPPRLVLDLIGSQSNGNRAVSVESDSFVQGIRVGSHTDRTRIVFDLTQLAGSTDSTYRTVDRENGKVAITFQSVGTETAAAPLATETTPLAQASIAAEVPVADSVVAELPAPQEIVSNEPAPLAPVKVAPVMAEQVAQATVEQIRFSKTKNSAGEVAVAVNGKAPFELRQNAPSEYSLVISGATATEDAKFPQLAAPGAEGIRSTRTVQSGSDVIVRMFVDSGVELRAFSRNSEILVVANAANSDVTSEARGQMKPEEEKAADSDANVEVAGGDETARRNPTGIASADGSKIYTGRLISLDLQETDIDNALRIIAEVSNLNIIASDDVTGKVTLRLVDVPWDQALDVILKTNGLDQVTEGNVIRIAPVDKLRQERESLREAKKAAENLEDLKVTYTRISYARATELKEQVEAVLTERGSVAVDERTNQLIVKDIQKGQDGALALLKRLDLRTPQVLLETQVVEASRSLLRDLGFQWNFSYRLTPETGNATGYNFPNSVVVGGGAAAQDGSAQAINFPAALGADAGAAISAVLDSADGSRSLGLRLSALEQEGRARVISRPSVATVNNKEAQIKSVETVRVRLPDSGLSVATGSGASASGGGSSAFEEIDVGITLRVTPQASPDYFVLLDMYTKSSTFGSAPAVDNIPSTLEREATSTVLVKSGQTFALGGVYRIEENDQLNGLPFLKDIPFLGHFFRRSFVDRGDDELIFFITPTSSKAVSIRV